MASSAQLAFAVRAINESQKALKDVQGDLQGVTDKAEKGKGPLSGFGSTLGDVGKIAGGFVMGAGIVAAPGILMGLNSAGKALELQMNKNNIVFGDQIGVVKKWADQNAASMGLTTTEATSLAAGLADLLIPMGMTREAAAEMSTKTIGLSGALAEWSGGTKTAAEVSDILTKAYLGETDGLKALGISISAADVSARLALKGQQDLTGAAREQAEAVAIQEMVFEKSTDAQTAFANGADSASRKQAEFSAKIRELKDDIAIGLQPVFLAVTEVIVTKVVPAVENLVAKFKEDVLPIIKGEIVPVIKEQLIAAFEQAKQTIEGLQPGIDYIMTHREALVAAIIAVSVAVGALVLALYGPLAAIPLVIAAGVLLMANWDAIRDKVTELLTKFQTDFPLLWKVVEFVWNDIENKVTTVMGVIQGVIAVAMALIHGDWDKAWKELQGIVNTIVDGIITDLGLKIGLVVGVVTGAVPTMLQAGKDLIQAVWDGLNYGMGALRQKVGEVAGIVTEKIEELPGLLYDHGWNAVKGLADGLWDGITEFLNDAVNAVIDKVNPANWFSTPEEHYRMLFGQAMAGIADEITKGTVAVAGAASGVIAVLTGSSSGSTTGSGSASGGISGAILTVRDALEFLRQGMDRSAANVLAYVAGLITLQEALAGIEASATSAGAAVGSVAAGTGGGNLGGGPIITGEDPGGKPIPPKTSLGKTLSTVFAGNEIWALANAAGQTWEQINQLKTLQVRDVLKGIYGTMGKLGDPFWNAIVHGKHIAPSGIPTFWNKLNAYGMSFDQGGWLMPGLTLARNDTGRPERILGPGGGDVHVHIHGGVFTGDERQVIQLAERIANVTQRRLQTAGGVGLVGA